MLPAHRANVVSFDAVPDQKATSAIALGYGECLVTSGTSRSQFCRIGNARSGLAFIPLSGASSVDDYDIPGETAAEKIEFLRTAAARCRRLSNATGDYELNETLIALADEYEAKIGELGGLGPPELATD